MNDVKTRGRARVSTVGGVAAVLSVGVLLVGVAGLALDVGTLRPWLAVLFGIDAGFGGLSLSSLEVVNLIDVAILVLAGLAFAGFWPGPGKPHKGWMALAILLPFAGIAVLLATGLWGRSGLMGGGLVLSALMISSPRHRWLGIAGAAVNALLLVGDFGTTGPESGLMSVVVGAGYLLLIGWFLWIAASLLISRGGSPAQHLTSPAS